MIDLDSSGQKQQKPLRPSYNKSRDILDTYKKNEGERVITIKGDDEEEMKDQKPSMDEIIHEEKEEKKETNEQAIEEKTETGEIELLIKERDELKEKLLRNVAEMENLRRRTAREKQEMIEFGNERLLFKLLEVMDDFGNAIEAANNTENADSLLKGVNMIYNKMQKIIEEEGVRKMEAQAGKPFDVDFHDAMMTTPSDKPEGTVVQEVQSGYLYKDRVLRHAKVITSSGPEDNKDS